MWHTYSSDVSHIVVVVFNGGLEFAPITTLFGYHDRHRNQHNLCTRSANLHHFLAAVITRPPLTSPPFSYRGGAIILTSISLFWCVYVLFPPITHFASQFRCGSTFLASLSFPSLYAHLAIYFLRAAKYLIYYISLSFQFCLFYPTISLFVLPTQCPIIHSSISLSLSVCILRFCFTHLGS